MGGIYWLILCLLKILESCFLMRYNDFSSFMSKRFSGRIQKISVNAGFTCPNRDGFVGVGGCSYCDNRAFNPLYCENSLSVEQQIKKGIGFFSRKYSEMRYLVYFQAFTNTYAELCRLKQLYESALSVSDVVGIVISTRPDCMPDNLLDYLQELSVRCFLLVEYGVESVNDRTLCEINRCHTFAQAKETIIRTASRGIMTGAHFIIGLPGEGKDDFMAQAEAASKLPLTTLKLHQLQIIKKTRMAKEYADHPEKFIQFSAEEYLSIVADYLERLNPEIVVDRKSVV